MTAHRAQTALAGWLAAFAGYAAVVTAVAQGPESAWGAWAAGGYGLGALAALRSRGPVMLPNPAGDPCPRRAAEECRTLGSHDRRGLVVFNYRHAC